MRTNLSSQFNDEQRKANHAKIIKRNTFQYQDGDDTVIRLHKTDIVRKHKDGTVTLNSGGYKTKTTKERMNDHMPAGCYIYSLNGIWYINDRSGDDYKTPYFDGMRLPNDFIFPKTASNREEKKEIALRNKIKKYVSLIGNKGEIMPNAGDCFFCRFGMKEDTNHLLSHIDEGYVHGSLIYNALREAGYTNPYLIIQMKMIGNIRRAVKRYLYRHLGLVV